MSASSTILPVSIIIATYNREALLPRALESVIPQCHEDDEIIVVDDASTDNTKEIIKNFPRVNHFIQLPKNRGLSAARNAGIRQSSNPLLAFLDDDDQWMPNKLLLQRSLFAIMPDLIMSFSDFSSRWASGKTQQHCLFNWGQPVQDWEKILGPGQNYSQLASLPDNEPDFKVYTGDMYYAQMTDDHVLPSTFMVRQSLAGDALFNENLRLTSCWEYSARLARHGQAAYMDTDQSWQNDDNVRRNTHASNLTRRIVQTSILETVWGQDKAFLEQHAPAYRQRVDKERLLLIREYLALGQTRAAREQLRKLFYPAPLLYRLLALLPEPLFKSINKLRQLGKRG